MIPNWIDSYCTEHGWTDPFVNEGRYWAFPPHAVIPLPVPASRSRSPLLPTNRFHIVRTGGRELFLFDLTVIAFRAVLVSGSWVARFAFSNVAAIGDWAELGLDIKVDSVEYRFDVMTMTGRLKLDMGINNIPDDGLQFPESWNVHQILEPCVTNLNYCLVEVGMEVRQCQQQQG